MSHSISKREEALELRQRGYSIKEIALKLSIAKSTASTWLSGATLSEKAKLRLQERGNMGRYRSALTKRQNRELTRIQQERQAQQLLKSIKISLPIRRLLCAIFFWTEGGRHTDSYVYFTNSDPKMVKTFITLFRSAFSLTESKFRALVHIHEYHDDTLIKTYWSQSLNISLAQFNRSYLKPHTKKRIRDNYHGCITVRYYDARIARELRAIYNVFTRQIIGP